MQGTQLSIDETKKIELKILVAIREFCKENTIRYYLTGGSLIGAVRHNGFIPWDDDIDILMPRNDYMKFIENFPIEGLNGYQLLSPYNTEDCCIVFSKVYDINTVKLDREVEKKYWKYGVDIDIFPIDGLPNDKKDRERYFKTQFRYFHIFLALVGGYGTSGSILKKIIKYVYTFLVKSMGKLGILNAHALCIKINSLTCSYCVEESQEIAQSIFPHYGNKEVTNRDGFLKQVELEFEGEMFTAPSNYHDFLTGLYGDYMRLPPVEKQRTHHLTDFYLKKKVRGDIKNG